MREESHLEDMRSAIRGDFERLAERRGEQELMRVEPGPETDVDPVHESAAAADMLEPQPEPQPEPQLEPEPEPEDGEPRRSWLARFLSP